MGKRMHLKGLIEHKLYAMLNEFEGRLSLMSEFSKGYTKALHDIWSYLVKDELATDLAAQEAGSLDKEKACTNPAAKNKPEDEFIFG